MSKIGFSLKLDSSFCHFGQNSNTASQIYFPSQIKVTLPNAQFPVVHQHPQYRTSSFLQWIPQPGKGNSILNQQQILASHLIVIRYHRAERSLVHVLDELGENRVALTPRPVRPAIIIVAACTFKLKCFNVKTQKQNSQQLSHSNFLTWILPSSWVGARIHRRTCRCKRVVKRWLFWELLDFSNFMRKSCQSF